MNGTNGTSDLRTLLASLPKVELHRHLEGSLRLTTLVEVAQQYNLDVPARDVESLRPLVQMMPNSPTTIEHFLSKFAVLRKFYCAPEVIRRMAREAVEDAAADNVKYMELRFTPKALTRINHFSFAEVIGWVCEAVAEACQGRDIRVQLIVSINRHESAVDGERSIQAAIDHRDQGVVGIDLCGQEEGYPARPFLGIFREARQAGMHITLHAGEWAGPFNIRYAIEEVGAERIGHGVRIVEDSSVVQMAREARTVFEVCPTSNLHSGVVRTLFQHPLHDMHALGLRITLNTDDPSISNITLSDELFAAMQTQRLTLADVCTALIDAAHSAFLPAAERAALVARLSDAFAHLPDIE